MKMMLIAIVIAGSGLTEPDINGRRLIENPIEPGLNGKIECMNPNHEDKTCAALSRYTEGSNGKIFYETNAQLDNDTDLSFSMTGAFTVEDGRACVQMTEADLQSMKMKIAGIVVNTAELDALLDATRDGIRKGLLGKKMCSSYYLKENGVIETEIIEVFEKVEAAARSGSEIAWLEAGHSYTLKIDQSIFNNAS